MTLLGADAINGVSRKVDESFSELVDQETFYRSLPDLKDSDYIRAFCDADMVRKIAAEYGVR